jgi:hypothetical protein
VSVAIDSPTEDLALLHPNQRVREFAATGEGACVVAAAVGMMD